MILDKAQDKLNRTKKSINIHGVLHDFSRSMVMGIINLSPDSFHEASRAHGIDELLSQAKKHIIEGAQILDLGAYSSRPGADDISEDEELSRLISPLRELRKTYPELIISVDTFRSNVADQALSTGADIINDISGGKLDSNMFSILAKHKAPYIMMHMQGRPQTMQDHPEYTHVVDDLLLFFSNQIQQARNAGVHDIIIDPGIGFGKTLAHNYEILRSIERFEIFETPILIGISRKSVINKVLNTKAKYALNGSTALHAILASKTDAIFRVHDVKEMTEVLQISEMYRDVKTLV